MTQPVTPPSKGLQAIAAKGAAIRATGQPLVPSAPKEIVINGKPTGRYLTGGNPVGLEAPPVGYAPESQLPLNQLPNYDKLTGFERFVMNAMSGIPKPITEALDTFNKSWAGQALSWLDIPAEALERGTGFAVQAAEAFGNEQKWKDFTDNLQSAWYAGSTAADFGNIPQITFDNGQLKFNYTNDMPGIDGTVRVRKAIAANVAAGMTYDQALEEAKGRELTNLGALAIRAQMQDMFMHVAGDPLNVIMPILKPVERLQSLRKGILATKIGETLEIGEDLAKAEQKVSALTDALQAAEKLGDEGAIVKATSELAEAQNVLEGVQNTQRLAETSKLSRAEQFVLWATGGVDTLAGDESKFKKFFNKINPFALTPEARAHEFVDVVLENVNSRLIPNIVKNGEFDVNALARAIDRAAAGASSPEFGHLIATIEGQHVKSVLQQVATETGEIARVFNATGDFERPLIDLMSVTLGESPKKIMTRLEQGEQAAVYAQFMRKIESGGAGLASSKSLEAILQRAGLAPEQFTPDLMKMSLNVFKGNDLYDSGAVTAEIMGKIADAAAQQSILRFGVTNKGFIQKLSDLTKQAETLAFMRLNPTYPVRNFLNNVVTMYARGALGFMTPGQIEEIFKLRGFNPVRLTEGVGLAGDAEHVFEATNIAGKGITTANDAISKAVKGERGWIDAFTQGIRDLPQKAGLKKDFGSLSAKIESLASENALATFYLRGEKMYNDFGGSGMLKTVGDFDPALAKGLGDGLTRELHNVIKDAKLSPSRLDELVKGEGALNISASKLRDVVEERLGKPIGGIFTDEFMESIEPDLMKAVNSGSDAEIGRVFEDIGKKLNEHIENLNDEAIKVMTTEVANRVEAEGPGAFANIWGDAVDEWYGGIARHDIDTAKLADQIRNVGDAKVADSMWRRMQLQGENYFNRQWNRLDARIGGLAEGAQKAGLEIQAADVSKSFGNWRDGWKSFFDERKALYGDFFEAKLNGKEPRFTFEEITQKLDASYKKAVDNEVKMTSNLDKMVAQSLPEELRPTYLTWRERVANLRLADKEEVTRFRQYIRDLPYEQIGPAYEQHLKLRLQNNRALWQEERMGLAAVAGNAQAGQAYAQGSQELSQIQNEATRLLDLKAAGQTLSPKEQKIVDAYIEKVADSDTVDYLNGLKNAIAEVKDNYKATSEGIAQAQDFANTRVNDLNKFFTRDGVAKKFAGVDPQQDPGKWIENLNRVLGPDTPLFQTDDIAKAEQAAKSAFSQLDALKAAKSESSKVIAELEQEITTTEQQIIKGAGQLGETKPKGFIPDYDAIAKPEQYIGTGLDELIYTKGHEALDVMEQEAKRMAGEPRLKWSNLSPEQQKGIERYLAEVKGQMGDARYAATRFGEFGRDSALLNYNRRYNYNTWLGTIMPYEFWATQSMTKWALHSIDRPAMLTTYLRMKKFLETAYRPENGLPSRLRGTLRIPMPFLPEWMQGEGFIDPLKLLLPFDNFAQPIEAMQQQALGDEGAAKRKLEELFNDGKITRSEYEQALNEKAGTTWERALVLAQQDDTEERLNPWDFATMLTSPHAPIQWAYNAMRGEETGAVLPITNTIGNVLGAFGLDPAGPLNPEAAIRKALGFHPFNKWDDYYVERALVNMVATGDISAQEAKQAMIDHQGAAWEEAYRMTWTERSMGPAGAAFSLLGLPVKGYPEGEESVRQNWATMKSEYEAAWNKYNQTGDYDSTVGKFNEKWPEYESRLALFDKPEVRLQKFMKQSLWDKWNNLDKIEKDAVLEQMPEFKRDFIDKNTRLESVPPEKMAVWLKLLGGDQVGGLDVPDSAPLQMPNPQTAQVAQAFYDGRDRMFPNWYETQQAYFDLPKGQERKQYLREHPMLKTYWGWRDDYLKRNSQIVPYVTDNAPKWYKPEMADNTGANLTWDEWRTNLGWTLSNLVLDYANGEDLPPVAEAQLAKVAQEYGWQGSIGDFAQMVAESDR